MVNVISMTEITNISGNKKEAASGSVGMGSNIPNNRNPIITGDINNIDVAAKSAPFLLPNLRVSKGATMTYRPAATSDARMIILICSCVKPQKKLMI